MALFVVKSIRIQIHGHVKDLSTGGLMAVISTHQCWRKIYRSTKHTSRDNYNTII